MRDADEGTGPVAGRPTQEVEGATSATSQRVRGALRQQTLFNFAVPTTGRAHEHGLTKTATQFSQAPQQSTLWGDFMVSVDKVETNGLFRTLSHHVNGRSTADDHADVRNFATTIYEKMFPILASRKPTGILSDRRSLDPFITC